MTYFLSVLAVYVAVGLCLTVWVSYRDWRHGDDFVVSDLWPFFVRIWIWPMMIWILLDDTGISHKVLIPGNRSAKLLKRLKEDDHM